jgi:hypothetical protein
MAPPQDGSGVARSRMGPRLSGVDAPTRAHFTDKRQTNRQNVSLLMAEYGVNTTAIALARRRYRHALPERLHFCRKQHGAHSDAHRSLPDYHAASHGAD